MKDSVLIGRPESKALTREPELAAFRTHAARGVCAGAAVLTLGSFVDLGILWGLQFQSNPQWEFIATINTLEAYTRFSIGLALAYAALFIGESKSLWKYRTASSFMLVLGVLAIGLGLVVLNDYFALSRLTQGQDEASAAMVVSVVKGFLLSGLIAIVFIPLGIMGLRRPQSR